MKKIYFSLCILTLCCIQVKAQRVAYYDALDLKKIMDANSGKFSANSPQVYDIAVSYFGDSDDPDKLDSLMELNPFLNGFVGEGASSVAGGTLNLASLGSSIGGIDVTNITNALADLMIDRAKQELNVAFFNRFDNFVQKNPEFQTLFPKTSDNVHNLLSYNYPKMLPALRSSFIEDLNQVTYNLESVMEIPRYQKLLAEFPEVRIAVRSLKLVHELETGESNAADIINKLSQFDEWKDVGKSAAFENLNTSVQVAAIFSQSLRYSKSVFLVPVADENLRNALNSYANSRHIDVNSTDVITDTLALAFIRSRVQDLDLRQLLAKDDTSRILISNTDTLWLKPIKSLGRFAVDTNQLWIYKADAVKRIDVLFPGLIANIRAANNTDTNRIWVSEKDIKLLANNTTNTQLYLGLVYQQIKNQDLKICFKDTTINLAALLAQKKDQILLFQGKIMQFGALSEKLTKSYNEIKEKKGKKEKLTNEDVNNYISLSIDATDYALSMVKLFDSTLNVDAYLAIVRKSNRLYKEVYTQQYTRAVISTVEILTAIRDLAEKRVAVKDDKQGSFVRGYKKTYENADNLDKLNKFVKKAQPYIMFIGNVADAQNSDDIKAALNNAILPVGSSNVKKGTRLNLSIQSYLGAYYGLNKVDNGTYGAGAWSDRFGVTAPIGVSFTPGFLSWGKGGALSLFASILDIGAVVDYRLKIDSVAAANGRQEAVATKNYTVHLGNIVSPGGYLVYGFFGNLPLSMGVGGQYGPGLSKIDVNGTTTINNPAWRWSAFLAVDLPFFNIVNNPKSTKRLRHK
jgi:hypothetical protein